MICTTGERWRLSFVSAALSASLVGMSYADVSIDAEVIEQAII